MATEQSSTDVEAATAAGAVRPLDAAEVGLRTWAAHIHDACPYLAPSMASGQVEWTLRTVPAHAERSEVEAALFTAGLEAAERVRSRTAGSSRLACEVVAVQWQDTRARQNAVLDWPHWALKHLGAPAGVMCGKFSAMTEATRSAPAARTWVLVLHAAIPARDHRFLASTPDLAHQLSSREDDRRSLLACVPGITPRTDAAALWPTVRAWARSHPHAEGATYRAA